MPEVFFKISRFLRKDRGFDTVICGVDEFSLTLGSFAKTAAQAPLFCVIEDPPFTDRFARPVSWGRQKEKRFRQLLVGKFLRSSSGIFCFVEKEVLREFKAGFTPVYQFMNGVSKIAMEWVQSRQVSTDRFSEFQIGYVGALNRRQGIDDLLEIFAQAREKISRLQLRLIGPLEKEYACDYHEKIRDLRLDGSVEVTGWLPYERMLEKLQECHIGVYCNQPSEWVRDAQPLKVCEYLALKKPTVAWDYPGVRRLLDGGRLGILVPSADKPAFARALIHFADPWVRRPIEDEIQSAIRTQWSSDYWYGKGLEVLRDFSCAEFH